MDNVPGHGEMILTSLHIDREEFERRTGWILKPEGACKGDTCSPLDFDPGDRVDVRRLSERLKMPLLHDGGAGLWCLGPESSGSTLKSVDAPALTLPTLDGHPFDLASLRGSKVLLVAWASW